MLAITPDILRVADAVWPIVGAILLLATLPGSIELLLLTAAGALPARRRPAPTGSASGERRLAVVVPAHDEEGTVARCVRSIREARSPPCALDVVVVADNCRDRTADRAREAGARVLERRDTARRGKGFALDFAFRQLLAEGVDYLAIVDADTTVDAEFLVDLERRLAAGADAVQVRYLIRNPEASVRTRLMHVALMAFNVLRPRGRDRIGLSCGLFGNGFALSRATLEAVPYSAFSVVEDLEYHLRLVRADRRVEFSDASSVLADMPTGGRGARTQRARWEGGRLRVLLDEGPRIVREVLSGRLRLLEPLLDLLLLPLAFHVTLLTACALVPVAAARACGLAGLAAVGLHVLVALRVGGAGVRELGALASAPLYIAWKLLMSRAIRRASRRDAAWVRTAREDDDDPPAGPGVSSAETIATHEEKETQHELTGT